MGSLGVTFVMEYRMPSQDPKKPRRHRPLALLLTGVFITACSSSHTSDRKPEPDTKPTECASYERELRACVGAVGAPPVAADSLAATLSRSDEPARLRMESACARDRIRLRASCK